MTDQSFPALRLMNNTHIRYLLVVTKLPEELLNSHPTIIPLPPSIPTMKNALLFKDEAACLTHQVFHAGCVVQPKITIF